MTQFKSVPGAQALKQEFQQQQNMPLL
jgi:hypothetical protein